MSNEVITFGATCVGIGSQFFSKDVLATGNFAYISGKCAEALAIIKKYKK